MKNKLFLSLALLVAANIATPAAAITFRQAAKITGKTILGIAALGSSAFFAKRIYWHALASYKWNQMPLTLPAGAGCMSVLSNGYVGSILLKSAWNDIKKYQQ